MKITYEEILNLVYNGKQLNSKQAEFFMQSIKDGSYTSARIASILSFMSLRQPSKEEIQAFASIIKRDAVKINIPEGKVIVDACGTGGDDKNTFNVSTIASLIASSCGITIGKHGNRAITSKCGSADLLEALGIPLNLKPEDIEKCLNKLNYGFIFAQEAHPSMKNVVSLRKEMGFKTIFNTIGPLTNPLDVKRQLVGVYSDKLVPIVCKALQKMGVERAMVVHGDDGLDEITLTTTTSVNELKADGSITEYKIDPKDFGFKTCELSQLTTNGLEENKEIALALLSNDKTLQSKIKHFEEKKNIVLLNTGAIIYIAGVADTLKKGVKQATECLESNQASTQLNEYIKYTQHLAKSNENAARGTIPMDWSF